MRWLAVRLDLISISIITAVALLIVFMQNQIPSAYAGLAISYAVQLTGLFQFTVRLLTETEARFTSVERINHYIKSLDSEAPRQSLEAATPAPSWPQQGKISFQDVNMRYQDHLPLVLKNLSFTVLPEETIGIVGRTGSGTADLLCSLASSVFSSYLCLCFNMSTFVSTASFLCVFSGKSSLAVALFRLVELSAGSIIIDGINIAQIGLDDLRSKLAIIPQEPVLFIGTVRDRSPHPGDHSQCLWQLHHSDHRTSSQHSDELQQGHGPGQRPGV
ncbi:Multidrug resistance-associated protein 5 [Xenoophorus captivus]|uniref:Multidrug resistance-associated protein 5 n=1 Tax=Xenoophorus captivus TaxID=1517983 RepID=A0ABV0Q4R5_9TELE